jgi:hypothetical protein
MEMVSGRDNIEGIPNMDEALRYLPVLSDVIRIARGNSGDTLRM